MKYLALILVSTLLLVTHIQTSFAQRYPTAIGVRLGFGDVGLTVQQPVSEHSVLEGLVTMNKKDMRLTGLYEYHRPTKFKRIDAYFGGGAHVGRLRNNTVTAILDNVLNGEDAQTKKTFVGLDGIAGLQWNMRLLPMNISVDAKPSFNFGDHPQPFQFNAAVSVRFLLGAGGGGSNGRGSSRGSGRGGGYSGGSSNKGSGTGTGSGSAKKQGSIKGSGTGNGSGSSQSAGSGTSSSKKSGSVKSNRSSKPSSPSGSTTTTTKQGKVGGSPSSKESTTTTNRSKGKVGSGSNSGQRTTTNGKVKGGSGTGSSTTTKPKIKPRNKPNDPNSGNENSKDKDTDSKESWD